MEPGGQLELSSAPAVTLGELIEVTGRDLAALRDAAAAVGLELCGYGLDPLRPPRRVLDLPRYAAMEKFFDREGPWGRQMMCGTASVQVCVDSGDEGPGESGYRARWRLLHAIGPVLVAAFANSPIRRGQPTGWRSARQQVWSNMNPGRTRAPAPPADDGDPRDAWTAYALDAELMCVREPESADWSAPPGVTFREWLRAGGSGVLRAPTQEDLDYHLSTLFPPVRPRGHMEVRVIDAPAGSYPAGAAPCGARQLIGDVWEWTSSDFLPYPGFVAWPYREYSEVFFGPEYKVLRGGSFAVSAVACRGTFRNWDYPIRRQIFSGFRTARTAAA